MASKFIWYELLTSDVAAGEAFYRDVVGWTAAPFGGGMDYTIFSAGERGVAGMMPLPDDARAMGMPPCWMGYIHVEDVDAASAAIRAAGGAVHREPTDIPDVGRFSVVADPDGAAFMLMKPSGPDQPPADPMTLGHVGWTELYAGDREEAFGFYAGQFGWTKVREFDMGEMGIYLIFGAGEGPGSGGIMTRPAHMPVSFWQFYFTVDDIHSATERVIDGGGKITVGPMEVPDGSWVVNAQDPQGAHFALVAAKKA